VVKKTQTSEFSNAKTRGVAAVKLDEGDRLVSALLTGGQDEIVLISKRGQALRTHEDHIRAMGRSSRGITGMKLRNNDELAGLLRVDKTEKEKDREKMLIISEYGFGKRVEFSEFGSHGRGTGGQRIYTVTEKTGEIAGCVNVLDKEEIMCITTQGKSIRLKVSTIRVMGRSAQGVRILNIDKPDFVVGLDRIVREDENPAAKAPAQQELLLDESEPEPLSDNAETPDEDFSSESESIEDEDDLSDIKDEPEPLEDEPPAED
jgi:DNA gyrase subunit A